MPVTEDIRLWSYAIPMLVIWLGYLLRKRSVARNSMAQREAAIQSGMIEPPSLHPLIDPVRCLGCGSCVAACPEGKVLGLIDGRAELINPSRCIGHGACQRACPFNAITLVFGSERRGVDIPTLSPDFETNVPGIFIAGELGGMGLIRNAIEQGRQAMQAARQRYLRRAASPARGAGLDVLIVGAGPAGIAAALEAQHHGLSYQVVEQDTLGGTVAHFPRGKLVMTAPVLLPLVGQVDFTEVSKEALLSFWQKVEQEHALKIRYQERLSDITPTDVGFTVTTSQAEYQARTVLMCIGRRGTPRKLGVEGEDQQKVVYRLIDPEQYRGQHVLVVGGGDSALEAACSLADEPGTTVTLSYRSVAFTRAKEKNRQRLQLAEQSGRLTVILSSTVRRIAEDTVDIDHQGTSLSLPNQAVIVLAGGVLPTPFLKQIGIEIETKYGTA